MKTTDANKILASLRKRDPELQKLFEEAQEHLDEVMEAYAMGKEEGAKVAQEEIKRLAGLIYKLNRELQGERKQIAYFKGLKQRGNATMREHYERVIAELKARHQESANIAVEMIKDAKKCSCGPEETCPRCAGKDVYSGVRRRKLVIQKVTRLGGSQPCTNDIRLGDAIEVLETESE